MVSIIKNRLIKFKKFQKKKTVLQKKKHLIFLCVHFIVIKL